MERKGRGQVTELGGRPSMADGLELDRVVGRKERKGAVGDVVTRKEHGRDLVAWWG